MGRVRRDMSDKLSTVNSKRQVHGSKHNSLVVTSTWGCASAHSQTARSLNVLDATYAAKGLVSAVRLKLSFAIGFHSAARNLGQPLYTLYSYIKIPHGQASRLPLGSMGRARRRLSSL